MGGDGRQVEEYVKVVHGVSERLCGRVGGGGCWAGLGWTGAG